MMGQKARYRFPFSVCSLNPKGFVMDPVLQILWIYILIKSIFDLTQGMTIILYLK
jgi:hypothetical protein